MKWRELQADVGDQLAECEVCVLVADDRRQLLVFVELEVELEDPAPSPNSLGPVRAPGPGQALFEAGEPGASAITPGPVDPVCEIPVLG